MPHELLQRVDAVGADVGADEHVHERIAHLAAPLVQPGAHIVDAGPGERLGLGGGQTLRIIGELDGHHLAQAFHAFAHLGLRGDTHHAVVGEEHAALGRRRISLSLAQPLINGRFGLSHLASFRSELSKVEHFARHYLSPRIYHRSWNLGRTPPFPPNYHTEGRRF